MITGCTTPPMFRGAAHRRLRVLYPEERKVSFTMVHAGERRLRCVRGRVTIAEGGSLYNNYIMLRPVKTLQHSPLPIWPAGSGASFNTVIYSTMGNIDVGSDVFLNAPETARVISRVVCMEGSHRPGRMTGTVPSARPPGVRRLLLSNEGRIYSIPELDGRCRSGYVP